MIGHPTPRRKAVWLHLLPSGQRQFSRTTLLLAVLLMALLLGASLAVAGCGSSTASTTQSTPTTGAPATTADPATTDTTQKVPGFSSVGRSREISTGRSPLSCSPRLQLIVITVCDPPGLACAIPRPS